RASSGSSAARSERASPLPRAAIPSRTKKTKNEDSPHPALSRREREKTPLRTPSLLSSGPEIRSKRRLLQPSVTPNRTPTRDRLPEEAMSEGAHHAQTAASLRLRLSAERRPGSPVAAGPTRADEAGGARGGRIFGLKPSIVLGEEPEEDFPEACQQPPLVPFL